ncbi:MAG: thioredoxin [Candidatus Dojkabacteria bacterium]|jgi:thioredoxin 1
MLIQLTDSNFKEEVLDSKGLILVDFWAEWCGPCQMLGPIIEEVAEEVKDRAKVGKMNVDQEREFPAQFSIMSIPTVILFKDGEIVETLIGLQDKSAYISVIEKHS